MDNMTLDYMLDTYKHQTRQPLVAGSAYLNRPLRTWQQARADRLARLLTERRAQAKLARE